MTALNDHTRIAAIVASPHLLRAADHLKVNDPRNGGRPAKHHKFTLWLLHVLIKRVWGGRVRKGIAEIGSPHVWRELQRLVSEAYPDRADIWLPDAPPKRCHYMHFRYTYLDSDDGIDLAMEAVYESGLENAKTFGLCQPGGLSWTHPDSRHLTASDGKVISAASRWPSNEPAVVDEVTGEILRYRRADPDVRDYREGGSDSRVRGHRFVDLSARGDGYYQRAILGIAPAFEGSELEAVYTILDRINAELEIGFLVYDGAARGAHIDQLLRRYGIVCLSPVAPKKAKKDDSDRVEHKVPIDKVEVTRADGTKRVVEVWAERGAACEAEVGFDGTTVLTPLTLVKLERRENRSGDGFRLYGSYVTSDGCKLRLRLYRTAEDEAAKKNRCEYLRAFGMDSDQYKNLYPRRADSEAMHRQMEDSLWQKRANVYGRRRVHADLLAWSLGENAIASYVNRHLTGDPPQEIAA